ncbi:MAG: HutD family protein [Burkholderiales bacterium]|nr:HutD family protein [Burkholderiales bacterium]
MSWHVVRVEEAAPRPWRNGGGVTRELLAWPTADDWAVRLSVADIAQDGPFSAFDGVDRWFGVLSGAGVWLGAPAIAVRADGDPIRFAGESAPACRLIDGATRDLNLMLRRGRATGGLQRLRASTLPPFLLAKPIGSGTTRIEGLFTVSGGELRSIGGLLCLPPMSLAWRMAPAERAETTFAPVDVSDATLVWHCGVTSAAGNTQ